jgi:hypothetical protein
MANYVHIVRDGYILELDGKMEKIHVSACSGNSESSYDLNNPFDTDDLCENEDPALVTGIMSRLVELHEDFDLYVKCPECGEQMYDIGSVTRGMCLSCWWDNCEAEKNQESDEL